MTSPAPPSHDLAAPRPATLDRPLVDALRVLASFAVVFHHMRMGSLGGVHFGVPLFVVIMLALAAGSSKSEASTAFAARKARFLLVPFVRWSLIYAALAVAVDLASGAPPFGRLEWGMLVWGGHMSLWFLPFAAVALACFAPLRALAAAFRPTSVALVSTLGAILATRAVDGWVELPMRDLPERAWLCLSPAILWGLAIGQSLRAGRAGERVGIVLGVGAAAVAVLAVTPTPIGPTDPALRFAVAVPLACLGFGLRVRVPAWLRWLAGTTFGIYVVHPLVAKGLATAIDVFAWPEWIHATVVWSAACVAVVALRRTGLRWPELRLRGRTLAAGRTPVDGTGSADSEAQPAA